MMTSRNSRMGLVEIMQLVSLAVIIVLGGSCYRGCERERRLESKMRTQKVNLVLAVEIADRALGENEMSLTIPGDAHRKLLNARTEIDRIRREMEEEGR